MTQKVQRQHAFTISLILNRIIVRSLTKPLPSSPLTVSERTAIQRLVWEESSLRTNEANENMFLISQLFPALDANDVRHHHSGTDMAISLLHFLPRGG